MIRILLLLLAIPAWSQVLELAVGGGINRQSKAGLGTIDSTSTLSDDYGLKGGFRMNFRMTTNSDGRTGHEFGYAYNRAQLLSYLADNTSTQQGMGIHQGFYNYLLYPTKEGSRIRPFAAGGVHFNNYVPPGSSATSGGGSTKFGVNYGGGLKIRVSEKFLWRFDVRQYINPKPFNLIHSGWIRMNEFSTSVAFVL
ncbi:MAG TPA: outer membrane beta-barrel protein [Bryobacteraceae bacterium]|nr:outer membrane beta-barrel protein [Bryobacteraceae bacterium]